MAFENSSAANPIDLIQKLQTFLVANGWTLDFSSPDGAGWRLHIHKGAQYVHLRANVNEVSPFIDNHGVLGYSIALYLGTNFVGGNPWNGQTTGAPVQSGAPAKPVGVLARFQPGAILNYYFFTDATNQHVVVVLENSSGIYSHFGWGSSLAKIGAWTGGDYFFATFCGFYGHDIGSHAGDAATITASCPGISTDPFGESSTYVRADVDSFVGQWIGIGNPGSGFAGSTGKSGASPIIGGPDGGSGAAQHPQFPCYAVGNAPDAGEFQFNQTSVLDGRANLLPVLLYAARDGTGGPGFSPLGTIPTVFCTSAVGQGFAPASDYSIGADTYTVFPHFAVKKVV